MTPAIVVITYDRPETLQRLLSSLDAAVYPESVDVPLIVTIDRGESPGAMRVFELARDFDWRFGTKRIVTQPHHLGLVKHFREAGRLSRDFEAIILLEDDLTVAPPFYSFASQALARYDADQRVGGVCLYDLWFNGFTGLPFQPLTDGSNVYFVRLPYTQGLALTSAQWRRFDAWWQENGPVVQPHPALHPAFLRFGSDEWFPALASYLGSKERYFCFPHVSLTTGWGDAGVHFDTRSEWFLAPVQLRGDVYRLPALDDSLAVYDSFFELAPDRLKLLALSLPPLEFDVDLNATKLPLNLHTDHVLTTRPVRQALARFGLGLQPLELNVVQDVPGDDISLARVEDVYWDRWAGLEARRRLEKVAWSKRRTSRRRSVAFGFARAANRLRRIKDSLRMRQK